MNCLSRKLFKNTLKLTVLILSINLVTSCNKAPKEDPMEEEHQQDDYTDRLKAHLIPIEKAIQMRDSYQTDRIDLLKQKLKDMYGPDFDDTKTVWFDFETIKAYIKHVEERSKTYDVPLDGILMYFGVNDPSANYKNQQSVFMAPTRKSGDNHFGFTLEKINGEIKVVYLKDRNNLDQSQNAKQVDKASFFNFSPPGDDEGLILNLGSSSPPEDNN